MGVVLPEVEEAIDATIERGYETVGQYAPLVVAVDMEEAAFVVRIGLCLEEMSVLPDVFLHVAMRIAAVIALQLRCETWGGVGKLQVVCHHSIGMYLRVAENGLHRVLFDADVAHEGNLRDVLGNLEVVFEFQLVGQWIAQREFRTEEPEVLLGPALSVIASACA